MKFIIIPPELVEKLKSMEFDKFNRLDPIKGDIKGKVVYFLQAELKDDPIFAKALADFNVCEVKEIETIDPKGYDSNGVVTTDFTKMVTTKTILTETIIKPIIK